MKKFMICLFAAAAALGVMATANTSESNVNSECAHSHEATVATTVDFTIHVESEGFGRCSKCNCKAFEGRGETCRNCGHAYNKHY